LSLVTVWHFRRFGSTLANRTEFAQVIPFIVLTTILIISVVKSQLALSLGMVGALSIVRFRTPIKEPEELAYLFLALAIGVGLGANQWRATTVAAATILVLMAVLKSVRRRDSGRNLYLSIDLTGAPPDGCLAQLNQIIGEHATGCDLRRFDLRGGALEATYLVDVTDTTKLDDLSNALRVAFPAIGVTFLDQSRMPTG
jgi:uncharacterized membrane protein YhiD involved in acid resistance